MTNLLNAMITVMGIVDEAADKAAWGESIDAYRDEVRGIVKNAMSEAGYKKDDEKIVVCVHNGVFHADDVICVALLQLKYGTNNVTVIRSRKQEDWDKADFVLDVGNTNRIDAEHNKVWFDHHEKESEKKAHANGVYYAACGKLAEHLGFPASLFDRALYAVEAQDNGQKDLSLQFPNPFSFISTFNVEWDKNLYGSEQDLQFNLATDMARTVLQNILNSISLEHFASTLVANALTESKGSAIVELDRYVGGWQKYICQHNLLTPDDQKLVVVFPSGKNWNVQVVPKSETSFESWAKLPFAGLRGADLDKASGIAGGVFVHPAGFLGSWATKEAALAIAQLTVAGTSR